MSPSAIALLKILGETIAFLTKLAIDLATGKVSEDEARDSCQKTGIHVVEGDSDAELAAYEDLS
jgi:hypothetical protein